MDATITKAEAALLLPDAIPGARRLGPAAANPLAAIAVRDAAIADRLRHAGQAVLDGAAALARAILGYAARRQTDAALRALTDRELADIGLTRFDIGRMLDAGFAARPANRRGPGTGRAA
jgi:uncharacterized protein YjiS (DUF1127 family)